MTNIKQSLDKIRSASEQLKKMSSEERFTQDISSVHQVLSDLTETVETLKEDINLEENSPIRCK